MRLTRLTKRTKYCCDGPYLEEYDAVFDDVDIMTAAGMVGARFRRLPWEALPYLMKELTPTKIYDLSGRGNHGTPYGGMKVVWDEELGRWVMAFDGEDDKILISNFPIVGGSQVTLEALAYACEFRNYPQLISKQGS